MSLEQNKEIVLKMYQAFDRQDVEQGREFMSAECAVSAIDLNH